MTSSRAAGWPLLVGAALLFLAQIPDSVLFGGDDINRYAVHSLWVPMNLVFIAGGILVLWALPMLTTSPRALALGWLGRVGAFLIFIAAALFAIGFSVLSTIVLTYLATSFPAAFANDNGPAGFLPFFVVAQACLVVGSVLLAVPMIRGKVFSRWPGYALLVSAAAGIVGFFAGFGDSVSLLGIILGALTPFLLFVALGWIGYHMITMPADKEALSS
jgi:hypothetical protein